MTPLAIKQLNDNERDSNSEYSMSTVGFNKSKTMAGKKKKSEVTQTKKKELALSIAIILSNLSNDE